MTIMKYNVFAYTLLVSMVAVPAMAQETYESANVATQDLNGTARYVGMGGAMEALGADISTIGTNPAGIGMFRHSMVSGTMGFVGTKGASQGAANELNMQNSKTVASFDQIGFVVSTKTSNDNFVNFGFNYHKGRNFNQIMSLTGNLNGASQNKLSYQKGYIGSSVKGGFSPDVNYNNEIIGYDDETSSYTSRNYSQMDYLTWNTLIPGTDGNYYCYDGTSYLFDRDQSGYVGNYDFNLSGNWNDRIYWGVTFGIKDIEYHNYQSYSENLQLSDGTNAGYTTTVDNREVTGQGFDLTVGAIFRPIEESPLRIGLSVSTPTWYELESENNTWLYNDAGTSSELLGTYSTGQSHECYKYKVFTPWKFGGSLGYTVGKFAALGFSYEYADYSALDNRNITDDGYDEWGNYSSRSESDSYMNKNTKVALKGVSTFKLGAELKPKDNIAVRVGYNYVTPMYNTNAVRSSMLNADGCYYMSTTDYVNWKSTNRLTCGVGFNLDHFNIDLAYQFSTTKGDFHPFETVAMYDGSNNEAPTTEIKNNRHQVLLTLGYRF